VFYLITFLTLVLIFVPRRAQYSLFQALSWLSWLIFSLFIVSFHWIIVLYSTFRIALTLIFFANIKLLSYIVKFFKNGVEPYIWRAKSEKSSSDFQRLKKLYSELEKAKDYEAWMKIGLEIDFLEGNEAWKENPESEEYDWKLVQHHLRELKDLNKKVFGNEQNSDEKPDIHELIFALRKVLHKNFGIIGNEMLYRNSVVGTKYIIDDFVNEVSSILRSIASDTKYKDFTDRDKFEFFRSAQVSLGKTALCLSGGGALSMYHMGVVRALCDQKCVPSIVSGTSGGSIVAAVLAVSLVV
jgi:hypothetical protein